MEQNDYDRLAKDLEIALAELLGNMHEPRDGTDSVTITKDGALSGLIRLQRAIDWCKGLAESHRIYTADDGG